MFDLALNEKNLETLVRELTDVERRLRDKLGFVTAVRLKVVIYDRQGSFIKEESVGEWNCTLATWMQRFMGKGEQKL